MDEFEIYIIVSSMERAMGYYDTGEEEPLTLGCARIWQMSPDIVERSMTPSGGFMEESRVEK